MKNLFLFFILLCMSYTTNAQSISMDSLKARYNNETIHLLNKHYVKGDKIITHAELVHEFSLSPDATASYQSYKSNRTTAMIFADLGLVTLLGGSIISLNNKDLAPLVFAGFITFSDLSIIFSTIAHKHFDHAVWIRNRDILIR